MSGILFVIGLPLGLFVAYELILMIASIPWLLSRRRVAGADGTPGIRMLIVIPAHNEGELIIETVRSVLASRYPQALRDVVVIADNCSDNTAELARAAGATCLKRHDLSRRGKPWALHWYFDQPVLEGYGGVVIIDADTVVHPDFLSVMASRLDAGDEAVQGFYGVMNPDETWLTRLAILPAAVKFYLNFPGKQLLGLSCPLAGNGMCFKAGVLRALGWNAFTLSEDWEYYLILATHGHRVTSAPEAVIYGQVASSLRLGEAQRMRWMKGRVQALSLHWRTLLARAVRHRDAAALDAIVDIARPTHSMLFLSSALYAVACVGLWWMGYISGALAWFAGLIVAGQILYFLVGLALERPPARTWLALAVVPLYLVWKASITIRAALGLRDTTWVKTTRN